MLLESRLRSFLQKSVNTLVEIIRGHVVIDYAEASDVDSSLVSAPIRVVCHFRELTLLFIKLNRFPTRFSFRGSDTLLFANSLIGTAFIASLLFLN